MESPAKLHRDHEQLRRLSSQLQNALLELQRYKEHKEEFDRHVGRLQGELREKYRENSEIANKLRKTEHNFLQLELRNRKLTEELYRLQQQNQDATLNNRLFSTGRSSKFSQSLPSPDRHLRRLQQENRSLKKREHDLQNMLVQKNTEAEQLAQEIVRFAAEIADSEAGETNSQGTEGSRRPEVSKVALKRQLEASKKSMATIGVAHKTLQQQIEAMSEHIRNLEEEISSYRDQQLDGESVCEISSLVTPQIREEPPSPLLASENGLQNNTRTVLNTSARSETHPPASSTPLSVSVTSSSSSASQHLSSPLSPQNSNANLLAPPNRQFVSPRPTPYFDITDTIAVPQPSTSSYPSSPLSPVAPPFQQPESAFTRSTPNLLATAGRSNSNSQLYSPRLLHPSNQGLSPRTLPRSPRYSPRTNYDIVERPMTRPRSATTAGEYERHKPVQMGISPRTGQMGLSPRAPASKAKSQRSTAAPIPLMNVNDSDEEEDLQLDDSSEEEGDKTPLDPEQHEEMMSNMKQNIAKRKAEMKKRLAQIKNRLQQPRA